jgi:hypothetical protein
MGERRAAAPPFSNFWWVECSRNSLARVWNLLKRLNLVNWKPSTGSKFVVAADVWFYGVYCCCWEDEWKPLLVLYMKPLSGDMMGLPEGFSV